MMKRKKWFTLF